MEIEYLKLSKIKPYDKNTRKHTDRDIGEIVKSIEKFGFNDPVGIWGDENIIVEGHGRYQAAKKAGLKEIPCIRLDNLTDEQRRAYAIAHNATAELSEFDFDNLADELTDIDLNDFDFPEINSINNDYLDILLSDDKAMSNQKSVDKDYFSISFAYPIFYREKVNDLIKDKGKRYYSELILKIFLEDLKYD